MNFLTKAYILPISAALKEGTEPRFPLRGLIDAFLPTNFDAPRGRAAFQGLKESVMEAIGLMPAPLSARRWVLDSS